MLTPAFRSAHQGLVAHTRLIAFWVQARSRGNGEAFRTGGVYNALEWKLRMQRQAFHHAPSSPSQPTEKVKKLSGPRQTKSSLNRVTFSERMRCEVSSRMVMPPRSLRRAPKTNKVEISDTPLQPLFYSWTLLGSIENDYNTQTLARSRSAGRKKSVHPVCSEPRSFPPVMGDQRPALK